jgi:hypothetical protein
VFRPRWTNVTLDRQRAGPAADKSANALSPDDGIFRAMSQVMNKNIKTTKPTTSNTNGAPETVETTELDNVIGGCANCGCGAPAAPNPGPFAALSASWRR